MTETRDIVLGTTTFAVPPLPLRHNRVVYPLCRDLSATNGEDDADSFFGRLHAAGGTPELVRDEEWDKLIEISFHAACAANRDLTRDVFDDMPITHPQLVDAFFTIRLQTGVWRAQAAPTEDASGEAAGADSPHT